jgi:hypothetical protein
MKTQRMFPLSLSQLHEHCKHFPAAKGIRAEIELLQTVFSVRSVYPTDRWSAKSWDSAVGTATGYGLDDRGVGISVPLGSRIFPFSTKSRPSLPSSGYLSSVPSGHCGRDLNLATHLHPELMYERV